MVLIAKFQISYDLPLQQKKSGWIYNKVVPYLEYNFFHNPSPTFAMSSHFFLDISKFQPSGLINLLTRKLEIEVVASVLFDS